MKKTLKVLLLPLFILIALTVFYFSDLIAALEDAMNSETSIGVTAFNYIASYFKHATTNNYLWLCMFITVAMVLNIWAEIGYQSLVNWLAVRRSAFEKFSKSFLSILTIKFAAIFTIAVLFVFGTYFGVVYFSEKHSVENVAQIEKPMPALVLGTNKHLRTGNGLNLYFKYRIEAAQELWQAGKVSYFIVSGDKTAEKAYDETQDMKNDLMAFGVPEEKIMIDTAGYRTLDSMLRIRELFKTKDLIVISQEFHVQRAVVLGRFYGINAVGFDAKGSSTMAMAIREFQAKPKMILDLIFFNMQPRVLLDGDAIQVVKDFKVNTNKHLVIIITLGISMLIMIGIYYKSIS